MRRGVVLAVFIISLVSLASANSIESHNVTVDLEDDSVDVSMLFNSISQNQFTYLTDHPVENIEGQVDGEPVDCEFEPRALGGEIVCDLDRFEDFEIDLSYETSGLNTDRNGATVFRYSQVIYRPTNDYNFKVFLPEGTGIVEEDGNISSQVIDPADGVVGSEGRRIHVEWSTDPSLGETVSYQVIYEDIQTDFRLIIVLLALLALTIGFIKFYLSYRTGRDVSEVLDSLTEDELMVFELIKDNEGMLQKDIVSESDYSKAKISGVVSSLEDKDIVSKEKAGRSNKVWVKDEYM